MTSTWPHRRVVASADAIAGATPNALRYELVKQPKKAPTNAAPDELYNKAPRDGSSKEVRSSRWCLEKTSIRLIITPTPLLRLYENQNATMFPPARFGQRPRGSPHNQEVPHKNAGGALRKAANARRSLKPSPPAPRIEK